MGTAGGLSGRRVVLATYGSLGDLHPFLALAGEVRARGGVPVLATSAYYRDRIEGLGFELAPLRPDLSHLQDDTELYRKAMDLKTGTKFIFDAIFMPHVRDMYDDLARACAGADLLVSHQIAVTGSLVASATGVPWASVLLAPMAFVSPHDPPVPPMMTWARHLRGLGPAFWRPVFALARRDVRRWTAPVVALRKELGLPPAGDPLFEGSHAPACSLALFSKELGAPQPDWPPQAVQTGFAFFEDPAGAGLGADLRAFLDAGPPPVVFTLGSSAVMDAGRFYEEGLAASESVGARAVLLIGRDPRNRPAGALPDWAFAAEYAPYSEVFPRASVVVHQGGVGTTGEALRAGRPMVVVPWGHDQPDNADRVRRRGLGLTVPRARFAARSAARALRTILGDPSFAARSEAAGRRVRQERGASSACDALERLVGRQVVAR